MPNRLHLFQAYGVELEYMIVDAKSLEVLPISDRVLVDANNEIVTEYNNGRISWSNELVLHVLELKSSKPDPNPFTLQDAFHQNVVQLNKKLEKFGAMLLPTAAHPWMDPLVETKLWPYGNNEIYSLYNEMFNCKGHGWSNLQSTHINLPFYDDEEFSKLHTAIRVLLPIMPALSASSPIFGGKFSGYMDRRLYYYQQNQKKIPSITGKVIPERIFSRRSYRKVVYERIAEDIKPYNASGILDPEWVNSRGAIARFDRGAIEIRIIDIQECPKADLSIVILVSLALKLLVFKKVSEFDIQESLRTDALNDIFQNTIKAGGDYTVDHMGYLEAWGVNEKLDVKSLWDKIIASIKEHYPDEYASIEVFIRHYQRHGSLSERIVNTMNGDFSRENLVSVYTRLSDCLKSNELF